MFTRFSPQAVQVLETTELLSKFYQNKYTSTEHLLLALSIEKNFFSGELLNIYNFDPLTAEISLRQIYKKILIEDNSFEKVKKNNNLVITQSLGTDLGNFENFKNQIDYNSSVKTEFSRELIQILRHAYSYAEKRKDIVTPELLLGLLLMRRHSIAAKMIRNAEIPLQKIMGRLHRYLPANRKQYNRLFLGDYVYRIPKKKK